MMSLSHLDFLIEKYKLLVQCSISFPNASEQEQRETLSFKIRILLVCTKISDRTSTI